MPHVQTDDVTWTGTLIDGRQYKDYLGHRRVRGIDRCVCLLDDMHFWIVACYRSGEKDNPPIGPFDTRQIANATMRLMS